jgi:segregation and condensation protein A
MPYERIFSILLDQDEITWRTLLVELVKSEEMDPWDIDVSILSNKYIDMLKKMKEMNLIISGKVILAAAILLRMKSDRLLNEDLNYFDSLMTPPEDEDIYDQVAQELSIDRKAAAALAMQKLIPKTPQPRKRKVSVHDLISALQQALEVQRRRVLSNVPTTQMKIPDKKIDLSEVMRTLYEKISNFFSTKKGPKLTFTHLVPGNTREAKVYTFIPLLHLSNQHKVNLLQEEHFGEIEIQLNQTAKEIEKELGEAVQAA